MQRDRILCFVTVFPKILGFILENFEVWGILRNQSHHGLKELKKNAANIVHGDIKPDNLLVTGSGTVKIGDFGVSQIFEDNNDELRRSPGTLVFTAPECCLGPTYHGKAADTWAVGVTFYCMVLGKYPFLGETLQDTYDKIVNDPLSLPDEMNPLLKNLLEGLLHKDPRQRMSLENVAEHAWVIEEGPVRQYMCWCKHNRLQREHSNGSPTEMLSSQY